MSNPAQEDVWGDDASRVVVDSQTVYKYASHDFGMTFGFPMPDPRFSEISTYDRIIDLAEDKLRVVMGKRGKGRMQRCTRDRLLLRFVYAKAHAERHVLHLRQHYSVFVPEAIWPTIESEGNFSTENDAFLPHPSPFAHLWHYAPEPPREPEWQPLDTEQEFKTVLEDESDEEDVSESLRNPISPAEIVQKAISTPPTVHHDANDHTINTLEIEPSERTEAPTVPPSPEPESSPPSPPTTPSRHVGAEKPSPLHQSILFFEPQEEEEFVSEPDASPLAPKTHVNILTSPTSPKSVEKPLRTPLTTLNTNVDDKEEKLDKKSKKSKESKEKDGLENSLPPKKRRQEERKNDENTQFSTPKKSRKALSLKSPSRRLV